MGHANFLKIKKKINTKIMEINTFIKKVYQQIFVIIQTKKKERKKDLK